MLDVQPMFGGNRDSNIFNQITKDLGQNKPKQASAMKPLVFDDELQNIDFLDIKPIF